MNKPNEWVNKQETGINNELFKKHINFQRPSDMLKYLYQTNDKEKIDELVNVINSVINSQISEEERIIENSDKIVKIVKKNY